MMLNVTPGAKYSAILGLGGYRPRRVVDNAEICTMIDSSDEWIRTRSGIIERRWASDDETIQMMSLAAARKALDRAGIEAGQIDTVIVSTVTHLYQTPAIATTIAPTSAGTSTLRFAGGVKSNTASIVGAIGAELRGAGGVVGGIVAGALPVECGCVIGRAIELELSICDAVGATVGATLAVLLHRRDLALGRDELAAHRPRPARDEEAA